MSHEHPSFRIQLGRRLEKVASEYFPSKTATAKVAGVSLEQFNKWIAGSVKVPIDAIYVLANTSDVDFSWLATGEGSISKESSPTPDHVMIQEIDVLAGCGGGGTASIEMHNGKQRDAVKKHWTIHKSLLDECKAKDARIVEVQGDSMTPTLHSGDRVIINMVNRNPFPSGLFCIRDGLGCVV
ncbi:MAG: hypothetical protein KAJ75_02770, partial [Alphaproteobacteria bacterium]|nr:hypothetical protein [Alphaproteobacteria bacterium]